MKRIPFWISYRSLGVRRTGRGRPTTIFENFLDADGQDEDQDGYDQFSEISGTSEDVDVLRGEAKLG